MALISERLATPLQFEQYLTRAFEEGFKIGRKPVTADVIQTVLAPDLEDLEPRLTRHGYNAKVLAELLNAKPREIKALFRGQLASGRTQELQHDMLASRGNPALIFVPQASDPLVFKGLTVFSTNLSRVPCSQAVLNQCGLILNQSEPKPGLVLNECKPTRSVVIERNRLCSQLATVSDFPPA